MGKIAFRNDYQPTVFRKIALGTWKSAADPTVYSQLDIDMSRTLAFIEAYSAKHQVKLTPTHVIAFAVAQCMKQRPEINGMIRRGKIFLRKHVSLFFQVNVPGQGNAQTKEANLSGTSLHQVELMSLKDIAMALSANAEKLKKGKDEQFNKSFSLIKKLPWSWVPLFMNFTMWLTYEWNLDLSFLGIPRDPFGSAMITNVGGLGIDIGWAPLCPYTRVPLLMTIGALRDQVIAENGVPVVRPVISIGVTFDHRFMDGVHAAEMSRNFKKFFSEPDKYFL